MMKNIKYSVSIIIIILLAVIGYTTYAEENTSATVQQVACTMDAKLCPDGVTSVGRIPPKCEFAKCPGELGAPGNQLRKEFGEIRKEIKDNRVENQVNREDLKKQIGDIRGSLDAQREEHRAQMKVLMDDIKAKREEFRLKFEANKEENKTKIEEMKAGFKENLAKIKDENKKLSTEKIVNGIQNLNTRLTDQLLSKTEQIENVLVSVESRIVKAEGRGINVDSAKAEVEKAKVAIKEAKDAIGVQVGKGPQYTVNVTNESTLKDEMKKLRDTFEGDIKAVREKVKLAHSAVRNAAVTLAQIPNVNNEVVEDKNNENSN